MLRCARDGDTLKICTVVIIDYIPAVEPSSHPGYVIHAMFEGRPAVPDFEVHQGRN